MARGILGASVFRGPRSRQQGLPLSRSYQMGGAVDPMGIAPIFQSPLLTPEEEEELAVQNQGLGQAPVQNQNVNQSAMGVGVGAGVGAGDDYFNPVPDAAPPPTASFVPEQRTDGYTDFLASNAGFDTNVAEDPYASISGRIRAEARRRDVPDNFLDVYANANYRRRQGLERFLMSREYKPDAFAMTQSGRVPFEETSFYRPPVQPDTTPDIGAPPAGTDIGFAPAGGTGDVSGADVGNIRESEYAPDMGTFPVSAEPDPMDGEPSQEPAGDTAPVVSDAEIERVDDDWVSTEESVEGDTVEVRPESSAPDDTPVDDTPVVEDTTTDTTTTDTTTTDDTPVADPPVDDTPVVEDEETDGYLDFLSRADTGAGSGAGIPANIRVEAGRRQVPDNFLEYYANAGYGERQRLERWLMNQEYRPDAFAQPGRVPFEEAQASLLPGEQVAEQQEASDAGTTDTTTTTTTDTTTSGEPPASQDEITQAEQDAADAETAETIRETSETESSDRLGEEADTIQGDQEVRDDAAEETADVILDASQDIADDATDRADDLAAARAIAEEQDRIQRDARAREILFPEYGIRSLADSAAWLQGTPEFRQFNQPQFDVTPYLQAGANAPRRDINVPETLYPWQDLTDEERAAGYTIPVYQAQADPNAARRFGGDPFGGFRRAAQTVEDTTVTNGGTADAGETQTGTSGAVAGEDIFDVTNNDTYVGGTREDWSCPDGYILRQNQDTGTWYCFHRGNRGTVSPIRVEQAAHGGPINAGIGNLMSRQRQYEYPDGTQMVEKVSHGRIPIGRR